MGEIEYEGIAKLSISDGTIIDKKFVWESKETCFYDLANDRITNLVLSLLS